MLQLQCPQELSAQSALCSGKRHNGLLGKQLHPHPMRWPAQCLQEAGPCPAPEGPSTSTACPYPARQVLPRTMLARSPRAAPSPLLTRWWQRGDPRPHINRGTDFMILKTNSGGKAQARTGSSSKERKIASRQWGMLHIPKSLLYVNTWCLLLSSHLFITLLFREGKKPWLLS